MDVAKGVTPQENRIAPLALQAVSLSLGRSPQPLLQDISFELRRGELALLLGAKGSGKTSLLRLLNGLVTPSRGQIRWQGQALSAYPPARLRQQVAWLPRSPRLLGMTVAAAIAHPLKLQGLGDREIQQRIEPWLGQFAIPEAWLGQRSEGLPPQAAQTIALIRALVTEPQLLLLDDPWPDRLQPGSKAAAQTTRPASHPVEISTDGEPGRLIHGPLSHGPLSHGPLIHEALNQFRQRGGMVIWAMGAGDRSVGAIAQRLLHLAQGRLIQNESITTSAWESALNQLSSPQGSPWPEPEGDEDWD